jgi:hypothetical protein
MLAAGFGDPVLMVRPHPARPPDRSGRTVGKRRPTLGHPLAWHSEPSKGFHRRFGLDSIVGLCSVTCNVTHDLQLTARRSISGRSSHHRGMAESRIPCSLESATSSVSHADGCCPFSSWRTVTSTHLHAMRTPCTDDGRINYRSRFPRPQIVCGVRCLALSCGWLSSR